MESWNTLQFDSWQVDSQDVLATPDTPSRLVIDKPSIIQTISLAMIDPTPQSLPGESVTTSDTYPGLLSFRAILPAAFDPRPARDDRSAKEFPEQDGKRTLDAAVSERREPQ